MDSQALVDGYQAILDRGVNMHAMLLVRNGELLSEAYFAPYTDTDRINIHSCTKSILSALVGIALGEGSIRSVNQRITDFFPADSIENFTPQKGAITLKSLLTMTAGLDVHHPDDDMKASPNWVDHVLALPMAGAPGTRFNYSDATAHLVSAILQKATGVTAAAYAEERLFGPMGIVASWPSDPQGISQGFSEITMTPRDMAKIGLLYLNKGIWNGRRLVPSAWVEESTSAKVATGTGDDYGYFWWCPKGSFQARGAGEQYLVVAPAMDLVAVIANGLAQGDAVDLGTAVGVIKGTRLPPNPDAVARLRAMEQGVRTPRTPARALPATGAAAKAAGARVSGRIYTFSRAANPLNVRELRITFDADEIRINGSGFDSGRLDITLPADGSYSKDTTFSAAQDTVFRRGYWMNPATFVVHTEMSVFEDLSFTFNGSFVTLAYSKQGVTIFDGLKGVSR